MYNGKLNFGYVTRLNWGLTPQSLNYCVPLRHSYTSLRLNFFVMSNKHISTPKQIRQWRLEILTFLLFPFWWHCYHMFIVVIITNLSHLIFLSSHWRTPHTSYLIKDPFIFIIWIHNSSHTYIYLYIHVCVYMLNQGTTTSEI